MINKTEGHVSQLTKRKKISKLTELEMNRGILRQTPKHSEHYTGIL